MLKYLILIWALALSVADGPEAAAQEQPPSEEALFESLKTAGSAKAAGEAEVRLRRFWRKSDSPTISLLFEQGLSLMADKDFAYAARKFNAIVAMEPRNAEAYALRGEARWRAGAAARAIADFEEALTIEPRHFAARRFLGETLEATGNIGGALDMYRQALDIYPRYKGLQARIRALERKRPRR